jgi:hypothetical protein
MRHQEQEQREEIEKAKAWKEHLIWGKFLFGMEFFVSLAEYKQTVYVIGPEVPLQFHL